MGYRGHGRRLYGLLERSIPSSTAEHQGVHTDHDAGIHCYMIENQISEAVSMFLKEP